MKRYQECDIFVRLYRRLKYQPFYFIIALYYYIISIIHRSSNAKLVFNLTYTKWQIKANWIYTTEEVFDKLKRSYEDGK